MTIRVFHYLDSIERGGTEVQALDVARKARENGIELTFASTGGALEPEFRGQNFEFIKLERRFPIDPSLVSKLRTIIHERQIELVRGHQAVDGVHLYLATRGMGHVKRAMSIEGFVPDRKNRLALKFLIPRNDLNIYPSDSLRKWLAEHDSLDTARKSAVLVNCADPRRLAGSGVNFRNELGIAVDTPVLGMIGNFYRDPRKDHLTAVRAFAQVVDKFPTAHFAIAGTVEPGAEEKLAKCKEFCSLNRIDDKVHFLGPRGDVPDILAALDVFVFSSFHEGLPIAVCEAMLAKVPVVASDIPPHIELSESGEFARLFRTGDPDDAASKILDLLSSVSARSDLAARAYRHAMDNFSVDAYVKKLRSMYEELLQK